MEMSHVEDKEARLPGALLLCHCLSSLFVYQSIDPLLPFVINQASSAPFPSPPLLRWLMRKK